MGAGRGAARWVAVVAAGSLVWSGVSLVPAAGVSPVASSPVVVAPSPVVVDPSPAAGAGGASAGVVDPSPGVVASSLSPAAGAGGASPGVVDPSPGVVSSVVVGVPGPPVGVVASVAAGGSSAGGSSVGVVVSWSGPVSDGGSVVSGFVARVWSAVSGGAVPVGSCVTSGALSCTVDGLPGGQGFFVDVVASNVVGVGEPSAPRVEVPAAVSVAAVVSGAPSGVVAVAGSGSAVVSWVAPVDDGGSALSSFQALAYDSAAGVTVVRNCVVAPPGVSCTVSGLVNGTSYWVGVRAKNAVGWSAVSDRVVVVPATVPGAPSGVAVVAGSGSVGVSWVAPVSDGGSVVSGFVARAWAAASGGAVPVGSCSTVAALGCTITGLVNASTYYVDVVASNLVGAGGASVPRVAVTPVLSGVADAPGGVSVVAGNTTAVVAWSAPVSVGSGAVTSYQALAFDAATGGTLVRNCASTGVLGCTITGLTNAVTYYVGVRARNVVGWSATSGRVAVTPSAVPPGPPTGVVLAAGSSQVVVSWGAPVSDGGSAVTSYQALAYDTAGGATVLRNCVVTLPAAGLSCTLSGLVNGTAVFVAVRARNAVGWGATGSRVAVTPNASVPGVPRSVAAAAGNASAAVSWVAPVSDGGSAVTSFQALAYDSPAGATVVRNCTTTGALACTLPTLANAVTYYVAVRAKNTAGWGPQTARVAVTPTSAAGAPGAPQSVAAVAGDTTAAVTWLAPLSPGGTPVTSYQALAYDTATGGTIVKNCLTAPPTLTCTITGLTNATTYYITARAKNTTGWSTQAPRVPTVPMPPEGVPSAPLEVTVKGGTSAVASWLPSEFPGVSPVTEYTARAWTGLTGGGLVASCTTVGKSCTIPSADWFWGTPYYVDVVARNTAGVGLPSSPRVAVVVNRDVKYACAGFAGSFPEWSPAGAAVYVVDCDLSLAPGRTLNLAPGTIVKVADGIGIHIGDGAALIAAGTQGDPVVITSLSDDSVGGDTNGDGAASAPSRGNWSGVESWGSLSLTQVDIRYADHVRMQRGGLGTTGVLIQNCELRHGVNIVAVGAPLANHPETPSFTIRDNVIADVGPAVAGIELRFASWEYKGAEHGEGDYGGAPSVITGNSVSGVERTDPSAALTGLAVSIATHHLLPSNFAGNTGFGNAGNFVGVAGVLEEDASYPVAGLPWVITPGNESLSYSQSIFDGLDIPAGVTLTLRPGAILKLASNPPYAYVGIHIADGGTLLASGSAAANVVMTSISDDTVGGDTNGDGAATTPTPDSTGIENRGTVSLTYFDGRYGMGVRADVGTRTTIQNSAFQHGSTIDVYAGSTFAELQTPAVIIRNNSVTDVGVVEAAISVWGWTEQQELVDPIVTGNHVSGALAVDGQLTPSGMAVRVHAHRLISADIAGNTGSANTSNYIGVSGRLWASVTYPVAGLPWVVATDFGQASTGTLRVPAGVTLTMNPGSFLKFCTGTQGNYPCRLTVESGGSLVTSGSASDPVALTSLLDDAVGGDTNGDGASSNGGFGLVARTTGEPLSASAALTPAPGDWAGVKVDANGVAQLNGVALRYAETALTVQDGGDATVRGSITDSTVGISSDTFVDASGVYWGDPSGPGPQGSGVMVQGSGVWTLPWTGYVAPVLTPQLGSVPPSDSPCADILFIGLRGSGELPQGTPPEYESEGDGLGTEVLGAYQAFAAKAAQLRAGTTIRPYGLHYAALGTEQAPLHMMDYMDSIIEGRDNLVAVLKGERTRCSIHPQRVVLAGYSQGALAIHLALHKILQSDASLLDLIDAVILIADPAKIAWNAELTWDGANNPASVVVHGGEGIWAKVIVTDPLPPSLIDGTITICHNFDIVCSPGPFSNHWMHTNYSADETQALGEWAVDKVISGGGIGPY